MGVGGCLFVFLGICSSSLSSLFCSMPLRPVYYYCLSCNCLSSSPFLIAFFFSNSYKLLFVLLACILVICTGVF